MSQTLTIWFIAFWFLAFLVLGQAVATCLLGAGIVGILLWVGPRVLTGIIGQDIFYTASTYSLSIIPLYLLMAQMLVRGGVIVDLYRVGHRLARYRRFPLGVATIVTGGLLGAVSGSGSASAAALASLAGPELERVGYTKRFSIGLAAIAGSLSAIIPPSLIMIIYGSLTQTPIGHLFIGAIVPGAICIVVYVVCLKLFGEIRPGAVDGTAGPEIADPAAARGSMPSFLFVLVLMFAVFGGIYGGVVTVGEAGALGAFVATVGMILMRRVDMRGIAEALAESVKVTAMLMMIVIGAQIFARFLSFSRVPRELLEVAEPLLAQPSVLIAVLLLTIFVAGMFLESAAVIVLFIPIIMPMLQAAQIDLLWFGVMASFMISIGLLTPPVGLSSYAAATAGKYPVAEVFKPSTLFAIIAAILVSLCMILAPGIVTWLPSHIG
ncbi:TRAP transporter large permease [Rhodoligotrophos defluvii]|uniref:TRAP transporter large permease n=1 Tax=Rhodoligotrophos defluvii TaxID=2561934 RepID=UPI0010CA1EB9|nr:TRAP transporter large permease subunit [Rhodoligotrophos defluvii]